MSRSRWLATAAAVVLLSVTGLAFFWPAGGTARGTRPAASRPANSQPATVQPAVRVSHQRQPGQRKPSGVLRTNPLAQHQPPTLVALGRNHAHGRDTYRGRWRRLCAYKAHTLVHGAGGSYVVRNDNFGGQAECISTNGGPDFRVTSSAAVVYAWQAYPYISRGCEWGVCSPASGLPIRVSALGREPPWVTWDTGTRAAGSWNVALDLWFSGSPSRSGPYGAEVMVWIDMRHIHGLRGVPVYRLAGARWQNSNWRAYLKNLHWNYLQFRRVGQVTGVRHLELLPFIRKAEKLGLVKAGWYLSAIDAGFEIVNGGAHLSVTRFRAEP